MGSHSDGALDPGIDFSSMKQPPLIKQLKGILSEYPDGGQILKELIQNAEDAEANEVRIIYDGRRINDETSGTTPIYNKFFKGPALCVYNDAVFTEMDWEGIRMIYSSVKEDDPLKVGRFGLGFKSVFHITDYPCILSGDKVLLIDPQQSSDKVNAMIKLSRIENLDNQGLNADAFWRAFSGSFGFNRDCVKYGCFQGTIMWFPLRNTPSEISDTLYDEGKVLTLFDGFKSEASSILLFLKNLENISVCSRSNIDQLEEIVSVKIEDSDGKVKQSRIKFKKKITSLSLDYKEEDVSNDLQMTIQTTSNGNRETVDWQLVNYFVGNTATADFQKLIQDKSLGYSPQVAVATQLWRQSSEFEGHVFCFLPLPREGSRLTGLPVHVHGCFALSQNRHHLKWETDEQQGKKIYDKCILWNKFLIKEALPRAYGRLVQTVIEKSSNLGNTPDSVAVVYRCVPLSTDTQSKWTVLESELYKRLKKIRFVYCKYKNKWITLADASFATFDLLPQDHIHVQDAVIRCLNKLGKSHVEVPSNILRTAQTHFSVVKDLSPEILVQHLHQNPAYKDMPTSDKLHILTYLFADGRYFEKVEDLELLPLASGGWTSFKTKREPIYICSAEEAKIVTGLKHMLVMTASSLGKPLSEHINQICANGLFQIKKLTTPILANLLETTIKNNLEPSLRITQKSKLTFRWLHDVWSFVIQGRFTKDFKNVHIVPFLKTGTWQEPEIAELGTLSDILLVKSSNRDVLPGGVCRCFENMGVKVVDSLPDWIPRDMVKSHFFWPSQKSIIALLSEIGSTEKGREAISTFNQTCPWKDKDILASCLAKCSHTLTGEAITVSKSLEIFRAVSSVADTGVDSSVSETNCYIYNTVDFPDGVQFPFKCLSVDASKEALLAQLGARKVSLEELVLETLNGFRQKLFQNTEEIPKFMNYFIQNFHLFQSDKNIISKASSIQFLRAGSRRCKPSDLFDPSDSSLANLLYGDALLPETKKRLTNEKARILKKMGLKGTEEINADIILQVAATLDAWSKDGNENSEVQRKAEALMQILHSRPSLLDEECQNGKTLQTSLTNLSCVLVQRSRVSAYPYCLPWFSHDSILCKPSEAKESCLCLLVGATLPIVICTSDKMNKVFGWKCLPTLSLVIDQLKTVSECYSIQIRPDIMPAIKAIYSHLANRQHEIFKNRQIFMAGKYIWTGEEFVDSHKMTVTRNTGDLDLQPFFYTVPVEFAHMHKLFAACGCHPEQDFHVLMYTLQQIREYHTIVQSEQKVSRDRRIVCNVLDKIARNIQKHHVAIEETDILMMVHDKNPNALSLYPLAECTYDDDPACFYEDDGNVHLVHEMVSAGTVEALGVKSITIKALLDAEELGVEDWGQQEHLTTRIHALLREGYTDGLSVPKELIQNADDAGASTVKFLYDERENFDFKHRLLSKGMKSFQGPALWIFNDAQFSDDDLKNITKLNAGTKQTDVRKIGKFGLGFCSVYNLTDLPSFVSGSNIVFFDPHEKHLSNVLRSRGLKYHLPNKTLVSRYADQFKPYAGIFGCAIDKDHFTTYDGTLFRLPLRTEQQARESRISSVSYTNDEMTTLLRMFIKAAGNFLLFSQNVKSVEIYHLSEKATLASNQKLLYRIEKSSLRWDQGVSRQVDVNVLTRMPKVLQNNDSFSEIHKTVIQQTLKHDSRSLISDLDDVSDFAETTWLSSWAKGTETSLAMYKKLSSQGAVPLAAVAVLYSESDTLVPLAFKNAPSGFYTGGHVFCFLPLPIKTELQLHINGCFAVTSDRRQLASLTEDDKDSRDYAWNVALMEDALVKAHIYMLQTLTDAKLNVCTDYKYYDLWPLMCAQVASPFKEAFYKHIIKEEAKVFKGSQSWVSFQAVVFLDHKIRESTIGDLAFEVLMHFPPRQGKTLIEMPIGVLQNIKENNKERATQVRSAEIYESEFYLTFLRTLIDPFWNNRLEERNILIVAALKCRHVEIKKNMRKLRCIPTAPNNALRTVTDLIHPHSPIALLFSVQEERFPLHTREFRKETILSMLVELGMSETFLPSGLLIGRCESISIMAETCCSCARERCINVVKYLLRDKVLGELEKNGETVAAIGNQYMLPILERPKRWQFSWQADTIIPQLKCFSGELNCEQHRGKKVSLLLGKPKDLYRQNTQDYVGMVGLVVDEDQLVVLKAKRQNGEKLLEVIGIRGIEKLPVKVLVQQATMLCTGYREKETQFAEVVRLHDKIFLHLEKELKTCESDQETTKMLRNCAFVLIGNELVKARNVAFNVEVQCKPYLYQLPETDRLNKAGIYSYIGVKDYFSIDAIIGVMTRIKQTSSTAENVGILNHLLINLDDVIQKCNTSYDEISELHDDIIAPDINGALWPTYELVIENEEFQTSSSMKILHKSIAPLIGERLGVNSKQRRCYKDIKTGVSFGQREELVTRIKGLLKAYPCDSSIMKELLQNADDAGATEIHFVKDYRNHSTAKLFQPECASLQGPSLCVYNNSYFTQKDIEGIHNLGQGSKGDDPTKTGQYGVGFNAVYHLTDTPSFVTMGPGIEEGGLLFILDPLCKHVPEATLIEPGMMCKVQEIKSNFSDHLLGFSVDHLIVGDIGTVFRLPLRTKQSEISKEEIDIVKMDSILRSFESDMFESVLFLKNIRCIKVSNITSGTLTEEYKVTVQLSDEDAKKRTTFNKEVCEITKTNINIKEKNLETRPLEVIYPMKVVDNRNCSNHWIIVQRFGIHGDIDKLDAIKQSLRCGDVGMIPLGGVAIPLMDGLLKISSDTHGQNISESSEGKADTVQDVHTSRQTIESSITNKSVTQFHGKAFCFLPLPIQTGLPVHINGHFALDHEARRDLWKDGYRMDWNNCIARAVIIPSWISGLHYIHNRLAPCVEKAKVWLTVNTVLKEFHTLFPVHSCTSDFWSSLKCQFYRYTVKENIAIFPSVVDNNCEITCAGAEPESTRDRFCMQWTTVNATSEEGYNGVYNTIDSELPVNHTVKQRDDNTRLIVNLLKAFGLKLLETPIRIKMAMEKAGVKGVQTSTPSLVIAFMKTYIDHWDLSCDVGNEIAKTKYLTPYNLNALINYIVLDSDHHKKMEGLPVLLTADGIVRVCSVESPVFISKYSSLLPNSANLFVHDDIRLALSDCRLFETNIFKQLKFEDFVNLLSTAMDTGVFANGSKIMLTEVENEDPQAITMKWLCLLYDFLSEHSQSTSNDASSTIEDIYIKDNIDTDALRRKLKALEKWSFLPCAGVDKLHVLVPLRETSHLLFLSYIHTLDDVGKALKKFHLPVLHTNAFTECRWMKAVKSSMEKIVASVERPYDLLQCLVHHRDTLRTCEEITGDDGTEILAFFGRNLKVLQKLDNKTTGTLTQQLRQLPLYLTQQGTLTDIAGDKEVLVLPKGMPFSGIQSWADSCNITLLQEKESLESVYECLGLTKANVEYVYGAKILPKFNAIPNEYRMEHILYVRDLLGHRVFYDDKQKMLLEKLKDIAFININGEMKRANELYDSQNEIFKLMVDSSAFPPSDLLAAEWNDFLKKLGLICDVDDAMMVRFARQVEYAGGINIDEGVCEKSRGLLSRFAQDNGSNWSKLTLSQIRTVKFIEPFNMNADKTAIWPQFDSASRLISFNEAISSTHSNLCWTSLNLLSSEICSQVSSSVRKQLGIHEQPPLDKVIHHCHNVCSSLKAKLKSNTVCTPLVKEQMICFYEFFRNCTSSTQQIVSGLQTKPFIHLPDEKDIVIATEVVIDLAADSEIKPYLYKAPTYYGKYYDLFQLIGSRQKPMFCQYAAILQSIKETSQENKMSVPERGIVREAFRGLVQLKLDTDESTSEVQSIQLPNQKMVLKNSKQIVVPNKVLFEMRLKGNIEIDLCAGARFLDIKNCSLEVVFARWPNNLRPVLLTDVVTEEVCIEISANTALLSAKARKIEKFLHSKELVIGLCRLLKHQCTEGAAKVDFDSVSSESEIAKRLQSTNVVEMPTLRTTLKYLGAIVAGSEREISHHIQKHDDNLTGPFTFYFNDSSRTDSINIITIFHGLITLVEICAPGLNSSSIVHLTLLIHALETPRKISEIIDNLNIKRYGSPRESQMDYFPKPGTYVEPQFIPFLEQGIRPFKDYEYDHLALDLEDASMETNDDTEGSPVFIYVKILREVDNVSAGDTNTGDLRRVYVVETGNMQINSERVPIYRLYRFIRRYVDMSTEIEVHVQHGERSEQAIPFDDQCKKIRDELKEAWKLPEKDRKKIVKRILFHWHPDKNKGNEDYCTEVFKYIQIILSRLENGEELVDGVKEEMSKGTSQFPRSSSDFYENVYRRAKSNARAYYDNFDTYNRSERTGEYSHGSATVTKHPDYGEAQRWFRQAKHDFQAADAMLPTADTVHAFNWICYICHQACEKALKSAHYSRDANRVPSGVHLTTLAITPELLEQARLLEDRLGDHNRLRYPDTMSRPRIPSDIFSQDDAEFSLTIARKIILLVADYK